MGEINVRMGEYAVSSDPEDVLVSIGLGSCIGLALVDARSGIAGLGHIMLPGPGDVERRSPGTFADTGVPALLGEVKALGARRLSAVLVGGAQMFSSVGAGQLQVGARNQESVRAALATLNIPVTAAETGGGSGRTIRVYVGRGCVTSRVAGGVEAALLGRVAVVA